jgi:hypothetical protein
MRGSNRLSSFIMRENLGRSWRTHFCVQRSQSCERASVISPLPPVSVPSMNRLDYNRLTHSPEPQTSSKTPRLPPPLRAFRVKIDSLDLPLTHPLAQPRPSFPAPETTMSCRSGPSPETHRDLLILPGGFSGANSRVETLTVAGTGFAAARYGTGDFFRRSAFMRGSNRLSSSSIMREIWADRGARTFACSVHNRVNALQSFLRFLQPLCPR